MGKRRAQRPEMNAILSRKPDSETSCWYCGYTRNVPAKKYNGLCMSCWWDFHEDDIALAVFGFKRGEIMHERLMELALVRAVPDQHIDRMKNSRLKGLYKKLLREVDRDLVKLPRPSDIEKQKISRRIERFGLDTGWLGEERHTGTILSFCAEMIERSTFQHNPKILAVISEIIEHLENAGDLKTACCWAGSVAADKWTEEVKS